MLWRDGKSLCERDGAALPVPLSDEENKFIADLNYHEDTWLGINDLETEGTFVDNDEKPITYSNWYRGEPNDLYGEDIAHIWGESGRYPQWNDDNEAIRGSGYIKHVVCVYKKPVELQPLDIKAKCDNSWNSAVLSGKFEPVAVFGGKAIYQNQEVADGNGNYWVLYFDIITDRWIQWYFGRKIAPGFVWRGETLQSIVSNKPGEFQCMLSADLEQNFLVENGECKNNHDDTECDLWAYARECDNNPDFMLAECKKSCNICSSVCKNNAGESSCDYWASTGECDKNPNYMLVFCKKSCNVCTTPAPNNPTPGKSLF